MQAYEIGHIFGLCWFVKEWGEILNVDAICIKLSVRHPESVQTTLFGPRGKIGSVVYQSDENNQNKHQRVSGKDQGHLCSELAQFCQLVQFSSGNFVILIQPSR